MAQKVNPASTLHGIFNIKITGPAFNGTVNSEIWNATPNKNRTVVLQSTVRQFSTGSDTVTDGKEIWQYDPVKNIAYKGPVSDATPTTTTTPTTGSGDQSQLVLNIVRTVFTHSDATLVSSSAKIHGRDAYDVHVVSQGQTATGTDQRNFSYSGEVY